MALKVTVAVRVAMDGLFSSTVIVIVSLPVAKSQLNLSQEASLVMLYDVFDFTSTEVVL